MRYYIVVACLAMFFSAGSRANDWSLSTFAHGPRSQVAYEASGISYARPRWRETQRRYPRPHRHRYDHVAAPELRDEYRDVRGYRSADVRPKARGQCLERVSVVGSQWANEQGAEESAQKAFMEAVRWESGEQWMEIANADGYVKRCSRSSIGELAGQTLHRCKVSARPCRPDIEFGAKADK
jgi:hypothetical protein